MFVVSGLSFCCGKYVWGEGLRVRAVGRMDVEVHGPKTVEADF